MQPNNSLISDLDLSTFNEADRETIIQEIYRRLEDQVGTKIAAIVSDEQFDHFETLVDQANEDKIIQWLETSVPSYEQIVQETLEELKTQVKSNPQAFLAKK